MPKVCLLGRKVENNYVVLGQVSSKLFLFICTRQTNEPLSKVSVKTDEDGIVECGHCQCMAGLGEVCSHIGATLFILKLYDVQNFVLMFYVNGLSLLVLKAFLLLK